MIKKAFKSFAKSRFVAFLASGLVAFYIRLMRLFMRADIPDMNEFKHALAEGKGAICVFWHERLLLAPLVAKFPDRPIYMLISTNRDGEIMVRGAKVPGVHYIRGSAANPAKLFKNKSGMSALMEMLAVLKAGNIVAITPDGPRGPARKVQQGVIKLAAHSGAPIIPIGLSARSGWHINSWDRTFLVNPFTRKAGNYGEPYYVKPACSAQTIQKKCLELAERLNAVTALADKKVGKKPIKGHSTSPDMSVEKVR